MANISELGRVVKQISKSTGEYTLFCGNDGMYLDERYRCSDCGAEYSESDIKNPVIEEVT